MKVTHVEKPKFCRRCGRHISDAISEQVNAREPCDDGQCTFQKEIAQALEKRNNRPAFKITVSAKHKFTIIESYKKFTIKSIML